MFLLNNHNTQKDRQNASRIDSVAKDITVKWQAMAKNDSVSKLELDSIHTEQAHYNALVAANDEKFSEIEKELEKLKENQKKFNERIDKASPEELAGFYRTRKLPSK